MSDDDIEMGAAGVRFPYHRFLADAAAGLFFLCICALLYYLEIRLFGATPLRTLVQGKIGENVKIFLMILLGVTALPLGLVLNGLGWFALGWLQLYGARRCVKSPESLLVRSTSRAHRFADLKDVFDLTAENFYDKSKLYEALLRAKEPWRLTDVLHVSGLKSLLRSDALVLLVGGVLLLSFPGPGGRVVWLGGVFVVASLLLVLALALLEYYHDTAILLRACTSSLGPPGVLRGHFRIKEEAVLRVLLSEDSPKTRGPDGRDQEGRRHG